jgi:hypothetical protein
VQHARHAYALASHGVLQKEQGKDKEKEGKQYVDKQRFAFQRRHASNKRGFFKVSRSYFSWGKEMHKEY